MYQDILSYHLAEGVSQAHLLEVAKEIIKTWMSQQEGFISWNIYKNEDDEGYTDIVSWNSKDAAKNAEKDMCNIPNAQVWYACYKEETISAKHVSQIL